MSNKKKKSRANPSAAAQPGSSDPGREVNPSELPPESDAPITGGAMPLGLPIPLEHYEALQQNVKRRKPRQPDVAQEDPG